LFKLCDNLCQFFDGVLADRLVDGAALAHTPCLDVSPAAFAPAHELLLWAARVIVAHLVAEPQHLSHHPVLLFLRLLVCEGLVEVDRPDAEFAVARNRLREEHRVIEDPGEALRPVIAKGFLQLGDRAGELLGLATVLQSHLTDDSSILQLPDLLVGEYLGPWPELHEFSIPQVHSLRCVDEQLTSVLRWPGARLNAFDASANEIRPWLLQCDDFTFHRFTRVRSSV